MDLRDLYAKEIPPLAQMGRDLIRDLDPQNDLKFLRFRSRTHEIMVSPCESRTGNSIIGRQKDEPIFSSAFIFFYLLTSSVLNPLNHPFFLVLVIVLPPLQTPSSA
jgi:hypothetical protein